MRARGGPAEHSSEQPVEPGVEVALQRRAPWKLWQKIALVLAVAVATILALSIILPANYQICESAQNGQAEHCAQYSLGIYVAHVSAGFLDAHNGFVTAIATVVIAAFTIALVRSNNAIGELANQQFQLETRQTDLAEKQLGIQGLQTDVLNIQKEIARDQFFAQHRPKLVLRDVYFSRGDSFDEVSFEISNIGGSMALVKSGFVAANFVTDPRQFKHTEGGEQELLKNNGFGAGQFRPFALRVSEEVQRKLRFLHLPEELRRAEANYGEYANAEHRPPYASDYYFFGVIFYTDGRGKEFEPSYLSVFRRRWNPETLSFERTGNPDHEYAD